MNKWMLALSFSSIVLMQGCNEDKTTKTVEDDTYIHAGDDTYIPTKDGTYISFEDFQSIVVDSIVDTAKDCGSRLLFGESTGNINSCIESEFDNYQPFYAFYHIPGIDTKRALATTMDTSGIITYWYYDEHCLPYAGSLICNSFYNSDRCENPAFKSEYTEKEVLIFDCSNQWPFGNISDLG